MPACPNREISHLTVAEDAETNLRAKKIVIAYKDIKGAVHVLSPNVFLLFEP